MYQKLASFKYVKPVSAAIIINLFFIAIVFVLRSSLPPVVPIYYGLPRGAEQLGPRSALALPPLTALGVTVIATAILIYIKDKFLESVLLGIVILSTLLSIIAFLKIFSLVGSV